jgi:hypothetical protein
MISKTLGRGALRSRKCEDVMDCGGKRSATPLSCGQRSAKVRGSCVRAKAPSPLRFAGAVQDANGLGGRVVIARGVNRERIRLFSCFNLCSSVVKPNQQS